MTPRAIDRFPLLAATLLVLASPLAAQATKKAPATTRTASAAAGTRCSAAPGDAWVKRQAQYFDDSKHDWTNDTLRTALLAAAGLTVPLAMPVHKGVEIEGSTPTLGATAGTMVDQLKQLAAARGSVWPTRSVVGAAGTHAVYLLAQRDTGLSRAALKRMMEAGPEESPAVDVAVFEDHMRLLSGRKQLYGTQFRRGANGQIVLAPMEDSAHADLRREDAGLPPFKTGLCFAAEQK